jgi:lysophospholipase L1-like esterase
MDLTSPRGASTLRERVPTSAFVPQQRTAPPLVPRQRRPTVPASPPPARRRPRALLVALLLFAPLLVGSSPPPQGAVQAYFFGDSLMSGTGSTPQRPVMARVAANRLGWDVEVDAWGGTGFTTTGSSPGYLERLRRPGALGGRYDVVLIEGGTNDARVGSTPAEIRKAVREVVAEVRTRQPRAQVVLMGAYDPPGVVDLRRAVADSAVRDVAADLGVPFFSPLSASWHTGHDPHRFLDADGLHPSTAGYVFMGARLADELRRTVPQQAGG